ncbi:MAG: hypothetical protein R2867_07720 [Caldilineaceae bacterium]
MALYPFFYQNHHKPTFISIGPEITAVHDPVRTKSSDPRFRSYEQRPRLEPRILIEDPERSYHAAHRQGDDDHFDNRLIFGDNLLALKALNRSSQGR